MISTTTNPNNQRSHFFALEIQKLMRKILFIAIGMIVLQHPCSAMAIPSLHATERPPINSVSLPGFGNWYTKRKKPRPTFRKSNQPFAKYIQIGGGYSFFQSSQQPKMEPLNKGMEIVVGYGQNGRPFSIQAGISTKTSFAQEIFVLKPTVIFGGLKYDTNQLLPGLPEWFNPYIVAGLTFTRAVLTDRVYPGIVNYEFKEETDQNLGGYAGLGLEFQYKQFHFGPQITLYASGIGQYLAGTFVKQDINIGQLAASFRLAYRFNLKSNKVVCPSYF